MKPRRRFLVTDLSSPVVFVCGTEAHHALHVLRLGPGAEVNLFDGRGTEATGRITTLERDGFSVEISDREVIVTSVSSSLIIAVATPKGERADWLVEKCAELGTAALWVLLTERGEVRPGEGKIARWRRKAIEAAKQAGRASAMLIEPPRTISEVLIATAGLTLCYGSPKPQVTASYWTALSQTTDSKCPAETVMLIGPEGGFTGEEQAQIEAAGGRPVRLSDGILRVETAAVAAACIWSAHHLGTRPTQD